MKNILIACLVILALNSSAQIKLIVRADDLGSSRSANMAIIDSYKNGITSATEVMVPCPWFNDAAEMLKSTPDLDVGLHLVLNSEWLYYKWRPLTSGKTLVDGDGYFTQMVWSGGLSSLSNVKLDMAEVEAEFRAQITMALKKIPQISHISEHMYFGNLKPELSTLIAKLAAEYHLGVESNLSKLGVKPFVFPGVADFASRKTAFIANLNALTPGTYHFLEHPSVESIELSQMVTSTAPSAGEVGRLVIYQLFTDPDVMQTIKDKSIELIGYKDLMMLEPSVPSLLLPVDSAQIKPTSFAFEWTACAPDIENYQIEISVSDNFETSITDSTLTTTKKTYTRAQLPQGRKLFWRVRAKNSKGWGAHSPTFRLVNTYYTAMAPPKKEDGFKAYFKAESKTINLVIPESDQVNYQVVLSDLSGKTIQSSQLKGGNGDLHVKADGLKTGVYIISASSSKSKYNQKIVIE
jgi:chitin disaccharide deacetylase